jgi:hypothetical protein
MWFGAFGSNKRDGKDSRAAVRYPGLPRHQGAKSMAITATFASSALIGQIIAVNLMTKLIQKNIIKVDDVREIADDALLTLEKFRALFPDNESDFDEARSFLDNYARFPQSKNP